MLEVVTGAEAFARVTGKSRARWGGERDRSRVIPKFAPELSEEEVLNIGSGDVVMTIGSCFAREIERVLARRGIKGPTARWNQYRRETEDNEAPSEYLNKYSIVEIAQELEWATRGIEATEEDFWRVERGWLDPFATPVVRPTALDKVRDRRRVVEGIYRELPSCSVAIVTLGLVECWYDSEREHYVNATPPRALVEAYPSRFELRVLDYDAVLTSLLRVIDILKEQSQGLRIYSTVSPVPLISTGRDRDVMIANAYSKSVQRAAVEAAVHLRPSISYFPSYEMVTIGDPSQTFLADLRHVNPHEVERIMDTALGTLSQQVVPLNLPSLTIPEAHDSPNDGATALIEDIRASVAQRDWVSAGQLSASLMLQCPSDSRGYFYFGYVLRCMGRPLDGATFLERATELNASWAGGWYQLAAAYAEGSERVRAKEAVANCLKLDPSLEDAVSLSARLE